MNAISELPLKRIGLIIPSSNRMVEQEVVGALSADSTAHIARLRMTGPHERPLAQLLPDVSAAAAMLADARCDAIAFHCTANSTADGEAGEAQLLDALRSTAGAAVTTTATAIREALAALAARRIVLITPYTDAVTAHEARFFEAAGCDVVAMVAADLGSSDAFCAAPAAYWEQTLMRARSDAPDAYVLSCANIACFQIIARAEACLGKPIVTSNQAILWATLRAAGAAQPPHLGRLMESS